MGEWESNERFLHSAIRSFRLGLEAQANSDLVKLIDVLAPYMEANATKMGKVEVELLNEIFAAQSRGDVLYLADLLEYEFPKSELAPAVDKLREK